MLDVKMFRLSLAEIKAKLGMKRYEAADLEEVLQLDERRRELLQIVERNRAKKNAASKEVAHSNGTKRSELIVQMQELSESMVQVEGELQDIQAKFRLTAAKLPNPPLAEVPGEPCQEGVEGKILRLVGKPPSFDFPCRCHQTLGEDLGWLQLPAASRLSGSRFAFLQGKAVLLQHGLISWIGGLLHDRGFILTVPPVLVREQGMFDTGFFPTESFEIYKLEGEDLYLAGTAEVPLAALHKDETLRSDDLPLRYAGYSTCFRREAGAHGRDTRGIFRVHQFDKMEMFSFCHPEKSEQEHLYLLALQEEIVQALELHYRVVDIAASSLGAPAARKFDIEVWLPSQKKYGEISSCSNCTDFQARRLGARTKIGKKKTLVHTLNGTAVAISRMLIAIMENYQQKDGKVEVPEVLKPYLPKGSL